jgi:hypothetical protein
MGEKSLRVLSREHLIIADGAATQPGEMGVWGKRKKTLVITMMQESPIRPSAGGDGNIAKIAANLQLVQHPSRLCRHQGRCLKDSPHA